MPFTPWYFIPLLAGFLYAVSALLGKRAFVEGIGLVRSLIIANWMIAVCFSPMFFVSDSINWTLWYAPVFAGTMFFLGQLFTFLAIKLGDVSVMTPIMGSKPVFVAIAVSLMVGDTVGLAIWAGAIVSAVAVACLGLGDVRTNKGTLPAILNALLSAAFFGVADTSVQRWAPEFGSGAFIAVMFGLVGIASIALVPLRSAPFREIPKKCWPWVIASSAVLTVQALLMAIALSFYGEATQINILYSVRGMWSVILVMTVGHYVGNMEGKSGPKVMVLRMVGSVLLIVAVVLVFVQ